MSSSSRFLQRWVLQVREHKTPSLWYSLDQECALHDPVFFSFCKLILSIGWLKGQIQYMMQLHFSRRMVPLDDLARMDRQLSLVNFDTHLCRSGKHSTSKFNSITSGHGWHCCRPLRRIYWVTEGVILVSTGLVLLGYVENEILTAIGLTACSYQVDYLTQLKE